MSAVMTSHDAQSEVFALLGDPDTYGGGVVKRIDTHAAAVFLTETRVYKVKRAVRFPFLDYSTPEKRKAACEAELAVNQAFAPQLYRRVVPITRAPDGRLALDGAGAPVDWALEMQRFDESATFDRLAERHELDLAIADELARVVAALHTKAPLGDVDLWIIRLARYIEQNRDELRAHGDLFDPQQVDALSDASLSALRQHENLLRRRGRAGLVRRGHGDLHLGNIVLIDGKPVAFDAIEFDPLMATGDLLYDLAFLLMDLSERGLDGAANVVLNRYLVESGRAEDLDGLAALPLFLSVRAAIRAKVTAAKRDVDGVDRRAASEAARDYFALAAGLITPPAPVLVAVGGLSGTGKSVLARALAPSLPPQPGAVVLRSDVERKVMFGVAETERLPAAAYSPWETERVYTALFKKASRVIAAGHSAVIDAVFGKSDEREQIAAAARAANTPFFGLFLAADLAVRVTRVEARKHDASDASAEVVRRQDSYGIGHVAWAKIDAGGTPEQTLRAAKAALASHASDPPAPR
jgi:hypothetical protein